MIRPPPSSTLFPYPPLSRSSAGQLGGAPALPGQGMNATLIAQTRLQSAEQFGQVLLRVNPDGSRVKLSDVARIELGGESYETMADRKSTRLNSSHSQISYAV